jgi:hypothetical protein
MYLRRKVFSSFIDENGEERFYSDHLAEMERQEALNKLYDSTANMTTDQSLETLHKYRNADNRVNEANKIEQERAAKEAAKEAAKGEAKKSGTVKRLIGKGKNWAKKTYGKDAQHRGRNIAITAAVPVLATGAVATTKAIKAKKARQQETNE